MYRIVNHAVYTLVLFACTLSTSASAFISVTNIFTNSPVSGIVQNDWGVNTDTDFTAAAAFIELDSGSLYNPNPTFPSIEVFPQSTGDSYVAANGHFTANGGIGAGDLGHFNPNGIGPRNFGPTTVGITWWSHGDDQDDIGIHMDMGRFSFTNDAQGTWSFAIAVANNPMAIYLNNPLIDGKMIFDPLHGDMNYDGFVGIADLNTVLGNWNQTVTPGKRKLGDANNDGFVGIDDLNTVLGNWNGGLAPRPTVPVDMPLPGDINGDGSVNLGDQFVLEDFWNQSVTPGDIVKGDMSGDGFVGMDDLNILLSNWTIFTLPPGSTATPEPGTLGLLLLGGMVLLRRRA